MAPSPPCSCSKAAWCSCHGCGAPSTEPSLPSWPTHTKEKGKCSCPSHRQTPENEHRGCQRPSPSRQFLAIRRVPVPPQSFFSAEAHPLEEPPDGRFAKALAGEAL